MELSTPDPWLPVVLTTRAPSNPVLTVPLWYSGTAGFFPDSLHTSCLEQWWRASLAAHHLKQGRAHKRQKSYHDCDRIARQAEQYGLVWC